MTPTCQVCDTTKGLTEYPSGSYCLACAPSMSPTPEVLMSKTESKQRSIAPHTPGPWVIENRDILGGHAASCHIATVAANGEIDTHPVTQANARLIAASPLLLEACQAVHDNWESNLTEAMAKVDAALRALDADA